MKKNVKNVAYIQDVEFLTQEQIKKYMEDVKNLSSSNPIDMYNFIVCCNKCYKITNFCLNISSGTLGSLSKLIEKNRKLDNCLFIATSSNANGVRDIIAKNIYFALSSLDTVLENYRNIEPFNIMTIVSDIRNPFFDEIYETGPKPAYRISELTVEKVNEFVDTGNAIDLLIALEYIELGEFEQLNKILLDPACKYKNFATFIELTNRNIIIVEKLKKKLASINNIASNVSINGLIESYPDIDFLYLYNNCAIQLVKTYNSWTSFIKISILFNRFTKTIGISKRKSKKEFLSTTQKAGSSGQ